MKKNYTKLLIIAIVCAIISVILCFISMEHAKNQLNELSTTDELMSSPGGGWFILPALMIDGVIMVVMAIFIYYMPLSISVISSILQIIAKFTFINEQKNKSSKVLTYISVGIQILLCIYLLFVIICLDFMQNNALLGFAVGVNVISIILFIIELRKMKKINNEIKAEVIEEK